MTACGTRLSLLKPDPTQGKVITILSHDVFGIIRSIAAFRLAGSNKGKPPLHTCEYPFLIWALSDSKPTCQIFDRCQHDRHVSVFVRGVPPCLVPTIANKVSQTT